MPGTVQPEPAPAPVPVVDTAQADISGAVRPEPVPSPPDEQAIPPVPARIEAEPEILPVAVPEPEPVAAAAPEPVSEPEPEPVAAAEPEPVAEPELEFVTEPELEFVSEAELEFFAEAELGPVAEAHVPAEVEAPVEAQANVPTFEPGDAAPVLEPEAATVRSGHPGRRDFQLEELFLPSTISDAAPEPDSSREAHAAEMASLKRRLRASYRRGPSMLTTFLLVLAGVLLLAGGAFFFRDTKPAKELLGRFFPPSGPAKPAPPGSTASAVEKPAYEISDLKSSYTRAFNGVNLFVIRGTVANVGKGPSPGIRVHATLLGKDNQALVDNTVFAGNLVDNTTLRHADRAVIQGFLGVRYGDENVNRDIPAGKSLPFMVVFFDPPGQVVSFKAKALDAE